VGQDIEFQSIGIAQDGVQEILKIDLGLLGIIHVADVGEAALLRRPAEEVHAALIAGCRRDLRHPQQRIGKTIVVAVDEEQGLLRPRLQAIDDDDIALLERVDGFDEFHFLDVELRLGIVVLRSDRATADQGAQIGGVLCAIGHPDDGAADVEFVVPAQGVELIGLGRHFDRRWRHPAAIGRIDDRNRCATGGRFAETLLGGSLFPAIGRIETGCHQIPHDAGDAAPVAHRRRLRFNSAAGCCGSCGRC